MKKKETEKQSAGAKKTLGAQPSTTQDKTKKKEHKKESKKKPKTPLPIAIAYLPSGASCTSNGAPKSGLGFADLYDGDTVDQGGALEDVIITTTDGNCLHLEEGQLTCSADDLTLEKGAACLVTGTDGLTVFSKGKLKKLRNGTRKKMLRTPGVIIAALASTVHWERDANGDSIVKTLGGNLVKLQCDVNSAKLWDQTVPIKCKVAFGDKTTSKPKVDPI